MIVEKVARIPRRPRRARRAADGRRPHPSRRRRAAGRGGVAGERRTRRLGPSSGPPVEEWRLESIDIDFFKELGRIVEPGEHPSPTIVGSRALAVDAVVSALTAARPRSVLLVGEEGVGKTTLIVEALRRAEASRVRLAFLASAADVNAGQMYIGMLEARVQEIVASSRRRPIVWVFPNFEDALWSGQHSQSPRGLLDALLPAVESGDVDDHGRGRPARLRAADPEPAPRRRGSSTSSASRR